ncbi:MAG: hypothetical protein AAFR59_04715 [Bacteroidota bacterium]
MYKWWIIGLFWLGFIGCSSPSQRAHISSDLSQVLEIHTTTSTPLDTTYFCFCIPPYPMLAEQVRQADPDIHILDPAHSQAICKEAAYACFGPTFTPGLAQKLDRWTQLSYVKDIFLLRELPEN